MVTCPDCSGRTFMRSVRLVEFRRTWWGALREAVVGFNAVCANRRCQCVVRVEAGGVTRLGSARTDEGTQAAPPPDPDGPKPRAPDLDRTPGFQWGRDRR